MHSVSKARSDGVVETVRSAKKDLMGCSNLSLSQTYQNYLSQHTARSCSLPGAIEQFSLQHRDACKYSSVRCFSLSVSFGIAPPGRDVHFVTPLQLKAAGLFLPNHTCFSEAEMPHNPCSILEMRRLMLNP